MSFSTPNSNEAIQTTKIHSVAGTLEPGVGLVGTRPFRSPHHTISDAGLVHLKGLAQLQSLDLQETHITDAGLGNLKGLTHLKTLRLGWTHVGDAGAGTVVLGEEAGAGAAHEIGRSRVMQKARIRSSCRLTSRCSCS